MTYFKAIRPNGTDFFTGEVQWAPPENHEGPWIVHHPWPEESNYPPSNRTRLAVSTVATDCIGFRWPCRLLEVTPVSGYRVDMPEWFPHKRWSAAWEVIRELPAHRALGPQGKHIEAFIESLSEPVSAKKWEQIDQERRLPSTYRRSSAEADLIDAQWEIAIRAAASDRGSAGNAAGMAAVNVIRRLYTSFYVEEAVVETARALVVRDLIGDVFTQDHYDLLTRPFRSAGFIVHPEDERLT